MASLNLAAFTFKSSDPLPYGLSLVKVLHAVFLSLCLVLFLLLSCAAQTKQAKACLVGTIKRVKVR